MGGGIVYVVLGKGDSMHWDWNSLARKQEKVGIYLNLVFIIYVSIHPAMPWVQRFSELNIAQKVNLDNHIVANDFVRTVNTTKQKLGLRLDQAATRTMGFVYLDNGLVKIMQELA